MLVYTEFMLSSCSSQFTAFTNTVFGAMTQAHEAKPRTHLLNLQQKNTEKTANSERLSARITALAR